MENKKHEWYGLAPVQREKLVLELLAQGYTSDMLNEYFDVKTKRVINDFMNARGYRKRDNSYIPKQQSEQITSAPVMQQQNNILPNIQIDEETIINVLTLSKQADKIQEIIDLYNKGDLTQALTDNNESKPEESYIEIIDTSLPIPKEQEGDIIERKTFRVNVRIYNEFMNFCKEKYPEYKQKDLMSLAFQMFMDKYK